MVVMIMAMIGVGDEKKRRVELFKLTRRPEEFSSPRHHRK
jgi:hypothetical protein